MVEFEKKENKRPNKRPVWKKIILCITIEKPVSQEFFSARMLNFFVKPVG